MSNTTAGQYRAREADSILRLEQQIERGDKRALRTAGAREAQRAARLELADVVRQQRRLLSQAYYDLVAAQRSAEFAAETVAGYERLVDAAERRLRAGDLAAVDLARLRVEAGRAANEARAARGAVSAAQIELAVLFGAERRAADLRAADDFPPLRLPEGEAPAYRIDEVVERRADAAAAAARVEALERANRLALAQRTRDVTVGMYAEHAPSFGGTVVGLSASIPLLVNNDYSGDIARAHAELEQSREELQRVRGAIRADLERAGAQLATAYDRASRLEGSTLPQAQRAAEAIEFAFARGAASLTDLFDARRQLTSVRSDAIAARADFAKALAAWKLSLSIPEDGR
jgi:cobalt-zinc-cadmium efflux system outer membrane protein